MTKTNWRHGVRVKAPGKTRMFGKNFSFLLLPSVTYSIPKFPVVTNPRMNGLSLILATIDEVGDLVDGEAQPQSSAAEERAEDTTGESIDFSRSYSGQFDCSGFASAAIRSAFGHSTPHFVRSTKIPGVDYADPG